ncbi:MAG: hypothetical protein LBE91_21230 [Tannerella sp.]|jgi:hypothetical protein|nr:hypothetical protein [Tannerella sp.]
MNIAFTICSNNYLAQAKVLIDSIIEHSTDIKLYIGLCDEKSDKVDYSVFNCEVIVAKEIGIENFDSLWKKYDIIELCTSIKASFFKYLMDKNPNADFIYYFDPDICTYQSLNVLNNEFEDNTDILLTPHIITPIPLDGKIPGENAFLNCGIYNLGFLGLRVLSPNSKKLLDWWEKRTLTMGFNKTQEGLFVDQIWINLVPLYFEKVKITKKMGYNVAPWNLHERHNITKISDGNYIMPDNSKFVFYHFSSYKYKLPNLLSVYYNRYTFENIPQLVELYETYHNKLIANNISVLSHIKCVYMEKRDKSIKRILYKAIKSFICFILSILKIKKL